jgi:hypothetical protein
MANGWGGKRPNSGRKPGSPNKAPPERLQRIMVDGHTPLEVMLANMRKFYSQAVELEQANSNDKYAQELRHKAQSCARDAAPYIHSRHVSSTIRHELTVAELTDHELILIAGSAKVINGDAPDPGPLMGKAAAAPGMASVSRPALISAPDMIDVKQDDNKLH